MYRRDRIVVSTLRCGRNNPGSNPGHGTLLYYNSHPSHCKLILSLVQNVDITVGMHLVAVIVDRSTWHKFLGVVFSSLNYQFDISSESCKRLRSSGVRALVL